jgi:hypothetical protein
MKGRDGSSGRDPDFFMGRDRENFLNFLESCLIELESYLIENLLLARESIFDLLKIVG